MIWSRLRRTQLDAYDRRTPVILPVAATEQHGEHLPLGTDVMIVGAILDRVEAALGDRVLRLPTQEVGCSVHHMPFPGSLTLSHDTFRNAVMEVADSAIHHGFHRIAVINGHGGNTSINGVIGEMVGQKHPDVECLVTNWWTAARERLAPIQEGDLGSVGHACEFETSLILAIAPDLVDMARAADGGIQHRVRSMWFDLVHGPSAGCYRPFNVLSENGVYGKPSLASREKGERILEAASASLSELISAFWPEVYADVAP